MTVVERTAEWRAGAKISHSEDGPWTLNRSLSGLSWALSPGFWPIGSSRASAWFIGGWLFGQLGISIGTGIISTIIVAFVGAVILLLVVGAIRRR
jgi:hypothetical protein